MHRIWNRTRTRQLAAVAAALTLGACSTPPPAEPVATAPVPATPEMRPAVTLPATPGQIVAATEQAFIELDLRLTAVQTTARGGCALARTADGTIITVTATSLADDASLVHIHAEQDDDSAMSEHLIESIQAHLSIGSAAMAP